MTDERLMHLSRLIMHTMSPQNFIIYKDGYLHDPQITDILRLAVREQAAEEKGKCESAVAAIAHKYRREHHASAENIADECFNAIRRLGYK